MACVTLVWRQSVCVVRTAALGHVAEIGDDETVAEGDLGREAHRRTTAAARHVVVISSDVAVVGPGRDQSLRCSIY
jgi:hypothetical protein